MRTAKKTAAKQGICEELSRLQVEFEQWRAARLRGTMGRRIPPQLWDGAVGMATRHGVGHVANALHLGYAGLKRRVELADSGQPPAGRQSSEPQFFEMFAPVAAAAAAAAAEPARAECVVELVNARGTKMRVEFNAAGVAGLAVLCNAFCAAA
jgi:hypothetical protein